MWCDDVNQIMMWCGVTGCTERQTYYERLCKAFVGKAWLEHEYNG